MIGCRFHGTCNRRRAFTLLEVLLTMSLLVILAALAWPAMDRPFAGIRLRKAAEKIRAEWRHARVEAMDAGQIYIFRYAADGDRDRYRIECCSALATQQNSVFGDVLDQSAQALSDTGAAARPIEDSLPEGVTFVTGETALDTRAAMVASEAEQSGVLEGGWSDPILFYPDGTTSTARLVLKNEHGRCIELTLRGLTGVVSIGEPGTSQEPLP